MGITVYEKVLLQDFFSKRIHLDQYNFHTLKSRFSVFDFLLKVFHFPLSIVQLRFGCHKVAL